MKTLLLDRSVWDLCKDAAGNIALAEEPYSVAQDAASAIRLFLGELWYDTAKGIPYFEQVLGKPLNAALLRARIENAALAVPRVLTATCTFTALRGRTLSGQVVLTYAPTPPTTGGGGSVGGNARAVISFVGDNGGLITFVGDNGGVVTFFGPG